MKQQIVILAYLICSALVYALPISDSNSNNQQGLDIVQIPLDNNKELDILSLNEEGRLSERNKRTIGILRDLFPDLSKQIEEKVNQIIGQIIRALGPTILRTAIQGNANRARNDFDSDFDDDDDNNSSSGGTRVQIDLPTFPSDDDDDDDSSSSSSSNTSSSTTTTEANKLNANGDNSIDLTALNQQLEETIRVARQVATTQQENSIVSSSNDSGNSNNNNNNNNNDNNNNVNDQLQSASESKAPAIDELTLDTEDDLDDRNKRFLNLGFGGTASGGGASAQAGGSIAGSGNFLFDIIRLFSGSIQPQGGGNGGDDERANDGSSSDDDNGGQGALSLSAAAAAGVGAAAGGGYTEGIPGPVTRLVVLANRGLANLIQDLILRIAATSERLVNFKARLITALI